MTVKKRSFPLRQSPFNRFCLETVSNTDRGDELAEQDYVRAPYYFEPMCFASLFSWIYCISFPLCVFILYFREHLSKVVDVRVWPGAECAGQPRRLGCPGASKMLSSPCMAGAPVRISSTEAPCGQRHGPRLGSPSPSACRPLAPRHPVKDVPQQSSGPGHLWDPQPERTHPQPHEDGDRSAGRHSQRA